MRETLSSDEARKLILLSQRLPEGKPTGTAINATLAALQHLGYIQIDTISVIARAHHHTFWNRTQRYHPDHLEKLLEKRKIFEYWSHAAAYLPIKDYRFSLPRMHAIASGQRHWFKPNPKMMKHVLDRITAEGPLRAQDFADTRNRKQRADAAVWSRKPAKQALEQLFMEGKLMTLRRQGFNKVYEIAKRVLPANTNTKMPSQTEHGCFLVKQFLRANGLGIPAEIAYQRSGLKPIVERCMKQLAQRGEIVPIKIADKSKRDSDSQPTYYALPNAFKLLQQPLSRKRLKILSPFDNLLIQRSRMQYFFDFDYRIECYVPAGKRKYGYFSLPLLWNGRLVARMDCKADRKTHTLIIRNFVSEPYLIQQPQLLDELLDPLVSELKHFAQFNQCERIITEKLHDKTIQRLLKSVLPILDI